MIAPFALAAVIIGLADYFARLQNRPRLDRADREFVKRNRVPR